MSSPPPLPNIIGASTSVDQNSHKGEHSHSSSLENLRPSILIILLILSITVLVSIFLCLLLRHLNRRCLRHLSPSLSTSTTAAADSRRHSSRRVSPEIPALSLVDSLPLFTFSSVTRRSTNASVVSGDCAVCLSKFERHDQLRLLPLCCHAFHANCVDTWLLSNQTCPLCRSSLYASDSDLMKALLASSSAVATAASTAAVGTGTAAGNRGDNSFRLEIGSISRRQAASDSSERWRSYSIGSFDYVVEEDSEVFMSNAYRRSISDKEEIVGGAEAAQPEPSLAAEVGAASRSWLKEYVDRLSFSLSSRALSFRSSGRFFTGSSRRSEISGAGDLDVEGNRVGEEISEFFRWLSGV